MIRSRWQRWLLPVLCTVPYLISLLWLLTRGQVWIVQIMLSPLVMLLMIAALTWWLAVLEFRLVRLSAGKIRKRYF
ncbi:hypothetical protein [Synechococcus sp. PROS-U-1]|uniref:hypothetical protein n=1 Tax=Synechococcus sp. PROS-U-1 TaxID=1400866 RepID=UPI001646B024|nr:hypothetical protein [Synechococcus sp. PROS-U-1]